MHRLSLFGFALLAAGQGAAAQRPVDGGAQLRQIPPVPAAPRSDPDIRVTPARPAAVSDTDGAKVAVTTLRLTGQTLFAEKDLIAATGFRAGQGFSLGDLRALAAKIADYYNSRGYLLAQAYLPAQSITDGIVTVAVIEGRYGAVTLTNRSRLKSGVPRHALDGLDSGDPVSSAPLQRRLLLLSDMPGIAATSTLAPGTSVGTSDLLVDVVPGRFVTGSVEADNAGNRYTGTYRVGGTINLNNPSGHGDVLSLRVLGSTDHLAYARLSYQTRLGNATVGAAYAHFGYRLGREFAQIDASGTADVVSLYGSYPLIRSRDSNLSVIASIDGKGFRDRLGLIGAVSRKRLGVATIGLIGDEHDDLSGGGWSIYGLSWSQGTLDIRGDDYRAADAATARSDGSYGKLSFNAARLQSIAGPLSLYASVRGQIATTNLDTSEKIELGGAYAVRAYPEGEAYGDQGYLLTGEARLRLPAFAPGMPGRFELAAFVDTGRVRFARNPWFEGPNHAVRSGYGAGISWSNPGDLSVKLSYARKLGTPDATSAPDRSGRFWVQIAKLF